LAIELAAYFRSLEPDLPVGVKAPVKKDAAAYSCTINVESGAVRIFESAVPAVELPAYPGTGNAYLAARFKAIGEVNISSNLGAIAINAINAGALEEQFVEPRIAGSERCYEADEGRLTRIALSFV
jgi:hypothetical protein